jgi:hypothetical protein
MVSPEPVQLTEAQAAFKSQVSKASWNVLASGRFFSAINGISQGIISMQPSMVLCNIGQLLVTTPMFSIAGATQSQRLKTLAASLDMFFGGLYTVGFATEIANKSKPENDPTVRVYDMSRLKQAFIPSSGMNIAQRASAIGKELVGMTVFAAQDHVDLVKNLVKDNTSIARSIANPNTWRRKDEALYPDLETDSRFNVNDLAKPSANKSRIAAMLTYAGTLPIVLLNTRIPDIGNKFIPQLLKGGAMLTANLSLFTLALNRDDWKGRAPLLGVPLSVIGNAKANNDFFVGIGQIGEAMNNLFFSDMAVNGLKRIKPKKQHSLFNAGKVNSVNGQILMGQGPESVNVEG